MCVCLCVGENYSNQFIFRNFPTEFHGSHADCLAGDQAPCLRGPGGGMSVARHTGGGWSAEREGIRVIITSSPHHSHHLACHWSLVTAAAPATESWPE